MEEREKLLKARDILQKIANGINPINEQSIEKDKESFLDDPRIIRCFFYISDVLSRVIDGQINRNTKSPNRFSITEEEKNLVRLPQGNIGVNEFTRCINNVIDLNRSKKLSGVELNKQLKAIGLLSEQRLEDGKTRTIINDKSGDYGIETEKRNYNGNDYDMVVFNDKGKRYLLDNIDKIMHKSE